MFREILTTSGRSLTLELPEELVGKQIEVLAFELHENQTFSSVKLAATPVETARRQAEIKAIFNGVRIDLSNYQFDRDEANRYDD